MQLPPTILSLDNHNPGKKKKDATAIRTPGKKKASQKTKSGPNGKPVALDPAPIQVSQDEGLKENLSDDSDEGGDAIMKDDDDVPPVLDDTDSRTPTSGGPSLLVAKALRHGTLEPPRTLETTLFDRLEKMYGPGIKRLLNVQYRCRTCCSEFPVALIALDSQNEPEDRRFSVEGYVSQ